MFNLRKHEPTMQEIEKRIKQYYVTIVDAPLDFVDKILSYFTMYDWKIYIGNIVLPICPNIYFYYKDYIRKNYKTVRYIAMEEQIENNESFPKGWVTIE